ncbi:hypothetical protein EW146_g1166 [Bondarzewia mesenterica]|uniref:Protein kinase domain-containing protein n=1 Tax=Bondarzewia mesenterica TaxID=1095465 RepID=A0A4S4M4U1_9AGAM|nr:hypothetical protein EW146_g1166 [Bondarzewia mesenterica]
MSTNCVSGAIPDLTGRLIDRCSLKLVKNIGSGAYGVVYRAVETTPWSPREFAVKVLLRLDSRTSSGKLQAREIALHQMVSDHPNVVTVDRVVDDDECFIYVVMNLCCSGDMCDQISGKHPYYQNDELVKKTFIQLIDAVQHCHDKGVYHRDLKPDNILCSADASQIFLTDFGLATYRPVTKSFRTGTVHYMSPECLGEDENILKLSSGHCDIWSLGIILVTMLTGRLPWDAASFKNECFVEYLSDRDCLRCIFPISREADDLLHRILALNPLCRISLAEMRSEVLKMKTFFLTDGEIASAPVPVRCTAKLCMQMQKGDVAGVDELGNTLLPLPVTSSSTWSARSEGPITPETFAAQPDIEVGELSDGSDLELGAALLSLPKVPHVFPLTAARFMSLS